MNAVLITGDQKYVYYQRYVGGLADRIYGVGTRLRSQAILSLCFPSNNLIIAYGAFSSLYEYSHAIASSKASSELLLCSSEIHVD